MGINGSGAPQASGAAEANAGAHREGIIGSSEPEENGANGAHREGIIGSSDSEENCEPEENCSYCTTAQITTGGSAGICKGATIDKGLWEVHVSTTAREYP